MNSEQGSDDTSAQWRPIPRTRAHELVIDRIEEQIASGAIGLGDRLPGERDLAAKLGVSRAAVREAMRALEAIGVVRAGVGVGKDSGTVLSSLSSEALGQLLRIHILLANFPMADVIEARVMLERWSVRLAAAHMSDEDQQRLRDLVQQMERDDLGREEFNDLDTQFHLNLAEAGHNRIVADLTCAIRSSMHAPILEAFYENSDWPAVRHVLQAGHREVLEAVCAGDGSVAADQIEAHIRQAFACLSWKQLG
ncbi:FadR/GntR family transcriptional regulator [Gephyromycinifex aptenodytis]|uniref:FadR/GntR family transcriptional regulator n=1 Tax=Gephyromycinifex aptenodytis TaxID=2716227 RepID=UPI001D021DC0|nr:FCD domain-containing protein [Gephyromycinifex aptenodytis]